MIIFQKFATLTIALIIFPTAIIISTECAQPHSKSEPDLVKNEGSALPLPVELTKDWRYRWGDSPLNEAGIPVWIAEDTLSEEWQSIAYRDGILDPPDRDGEKYLWLRVGFTSGDWKDAHLFINHVRFACEVYIDGQVIYKSAGMNEPRTYRSVVPRWHMIPIESDSSNQVAFFRIYSDDPHVVGIEQVSIGAGSDFIRRMMADEIQLIILGFLFIATGLVPLLVFIRKREKKIYFAFGFFTLSIGMATLGEAEDLLQLFWGLPTVLFSVLLIFYFLTPVGLCMYFEQIFGAGFKSGIRRLRQIHLGYAVLCSVILILNVFPVSYLEIFSIFYFIIFFFTMLFLLGTSVVSAIRGRTEARIITAGFAIFWGLGIYDILGRGLYLIPSWSGVTYPWGMLIFILSLGFVLERRFQQYADELEVSNAKLQEYSQTLEQKVEERTHALKEAQSQLIMKEKMASLGSLVAGVAHEVNTPIGAIYSAADVTRRCIEKIQSLLKSGQTLKEANSNTQLHKSFKILEDNNKVTTTASKRIAKIVQSLKTFARLDEAEFLKADIHEGLDSTLTLIDHEIKTRITVIKQYGEIPEIECYPNELNQVFMNVLMNAVQAIEQDGQIVIKTYLEDDKVIVKISDDGRGIPPDAMDKIFNPGFTSKGVGVGTGLGLSISYNIIQKHHGEIRVESEVGKGTTFFIILGTELKTQ
jgi:signal transduction histidine kinase